MPDVTQYLIDVQVLEVGVNGPDGANRLYICAGRCANAWQGYNSSETFTFNVGPKLGRRDFIGATGLATASGSYVQSAPGTITCKGFDADWDDDSGRARVTFQVQSQGQAGITGFDYHVSILAEVTPA
jgi:hypothetical protein